MTQNAPNAKTQHSKLRQLKRHLGDALLWLLAATLLLWLGDWAVWRIRVWHGGGYDMVEVSQFLLTPLKNHRVKADQQSTASQPCTRSIFPHNGDNPCWWLRRHATEFQNASLLDPREPNRRAVPDPDKGSRAARETAVEE